jgi:hypothetical protein
MPKRRSGARVVRTGAGRALHWLNGTWRTEGQLVGLPRGPRTTLAAVDRYEWLPGVDLLAHYVAGHLGPTSVASFEVWAYDRRRRTYVSTSFDEDGVTSTFEARLRGRQWTIHGATQRFRGTFSANGDILSGTWDQKAGRVWKPWLTITLHKVGS